MGNSDHHDSFDMAEISNDVARFMDQQKLTMATLGGHGFGAKVALATAVNNMDRTTGVIQLEGGPLDHTYYEAYQELRDFVNIANGLDLKSVDYAKAVKFLKENITDSKWASIFIQNLEDKGNSVVWKSNIPEVAANMRLHESDLATWKQTYGLWPGQALAIFAAHSRWVHLSTNTLPFYWIMPRLQN